MAVLISDTDIKDVERLFAEARKYPLLSSEQERTIDGEKWTLIAMPQQALLEDPGGEAAASMSSFRSLLTDNTPAVDFADLLEALSLPASLVAGLPLPKTWTLS